MRRLAKAPSAASTSSTGWKLGRMVPVVALALLVLALGASSAFAALSHPFDSDIGVGELGFPSGVGVEQGTGNVYASDTTVGSVFKFGPSGAPANFSALGSNQISAPLGNQAALAVDNSATASAGRIYSQDYRVILAFQASGSPSNFTASAPYIADNTLTGTPFGNFNTVAGIAVDANGSIYVADFYDEHIAVFASSGEYLTRFKVPSGGYPGPLAVDSVGNVYAAGELTRRYTPSSFPVSATTTYGNPTFVAGSSKAVAVDPADDGVYVLRSVGAGAEVEQFNSAAAGNDLLGRSGVNELTAGALGIAVDRSGGAGDGGFLVSTQNRVARFGTAVTLPDSTTGAATAVTSTTATLGGTINPVGTAASYQFEYGTSTSYGQKAPLSPAAAGNDSSDHPVSAGITGLQPETTYHYRVVGSNPAGSYPAADGTFTTLTAVKEVKTGKATNLTPTSARLNGTVDPGGLVVGSCKFEYGSTESLGQSAPCAQSSGEIGSGEGPVPVHADISGLNTGLYYFRLVASNAVGTTMGSSQIAAVPGPPVILGQSAGVEQGKVFLRARVNPANQPTTYFFEFGLTSAYGESTPAETLAAGNNQVFVSEQVNGLIAGAEYHFRLVASNGIATVQGPDQTFRAEPGPTGDSCANAPIRAAQGTADLPDCRAYEHVSAGGKNGKSLFGVGFPLVYLTATNPGGTAATFQSNGAFGDAQGGSTLTDYVAQRGPTGWATHAISDRRYQGANFAATMSAGAWSEDLSHAVAYAGDGGLAPGVAPLAPGASPGVTNIYRNDLGTHAFSAVSLDVGIPPLFDTSFFLAFVGGSSDFSTIVFEDANPHATNTPSTSFMNSYAWHEDGTSELVGILPNGEISGEAVVGAGSYASRQNAVSKDGSRIFFTTTDGRIFVRIDRTKTVAVSASQKTVPDAQQSAVYRTATPDGRYAFFTTAEQLVDADTNGVVDLYRFDVDTKTLTWISKGAQNPSYFGVTGVAGASADGSYVYFTSRFADFDGVIPSSVSDAEGREFYGWHNGQFEYVGSAMSSDLTDGSTPLADVTPDGRAITFSTGYEQSLLPEFDTRGTKQVYAYYADTETLVCVSCRPDGKASTGDALQPRQTLDSKGDGLRPAVNVNLLSDDGSRVFFTSPDPLVSRDVNGKNDAYEYRDGKVHLLSSGLSEGDSNFQNSTPDGNSAFFTTIEPLIPSDRDVSIDLYDARTGGGFDEIAPLPCGGEGSCRPAVTPPPASESAGSAQFSGPGNAQRKAHKNKKKKRKQARHKKARHGKGKQKPGKQKPGTPGSKQGAGK